MDPATANVTASSSSNPNEGNYQQHSILSEKVARALTVRTDTVAMKAALEALAHLEQPVPFNGSSITTATGTAPTGSATAATFVIDSRSVRTAMEHDAFVQAMALQTALVQIVATVTAVREGCAQVAQTARQVRQAISMPVITAETANSMLPSTITSATSPTGSAANDGTTFDSSPMAGTGTTSTIVDSSMTDAATLAEQKLAERLSDAFVHRDQARQRLQAVHAFLETFDLSEHDSALLDHYNFADIGSNNSNSNNEMGVSVSAAAHDGFAFLNALSRVRKIRQALNQTFGPDTMSASDGTNNSGSGGLGTSSALRMLESLSQKQEGAYERLYHWLQQHLQLSSSSFDAAGSSSSDFAFDSDDGSSALTLQNDFVLQALYTLRQVPAFYNHLTELMAASRRTSVTRHFLLALTTGSADGSTPPLEMKAHDAVAYVGDMLAFAFRTFSVEADLAKGLLLFHPEHGGDESTNERTETDEQVHDDDDLGGAERPISAENMLSIGMSGLSRPLKSRILQVVSTLSRRPDDEEVESDDGVDDDLDEQGTVVRTRVGHLYEICGLLLFYARTMEKGVDKLRGSTASASKSGSSAVVTNDDQNPLVECLLECLSEASKGYEATVRVYGAMLDQLSILTGDSEATFVYQMIALLADVRLGSPGFSGDVDCPEDCQRSLSMEWLTETLVEGCLAKCNTLDDAIALKQSLAASKKAGMSVASAEKLDREIEQKETALVEKLVQAEAAMVLDVCGLGNLVDACNRWKNQNQPPTMASYPGLSPSEVEAGMRDFFASLYSPPLPSLEGTIKDVAARKAVRSKIAETVCTAYAGMYQSMTSSPQVGGYADTGFLIHRPDEVATLFSV